MKRLLVFAITASLLADTAVAQTSELPRLTPELLDDHFLVGADLWSAATDRLVAKGFASAGKARLVANRPDLLLRPGHSEAPPGFAGEGALLVRIGGKPSYPSMEVCHPPHACTHEMARPVMPGPAMSSDMRRVVYIKGGDIWQAEVDWAAGRIVNHRQVTKIGVLGNASISQWPQALHWYRNTIFLRWDRNREKPILKIDLATSAVVEMEATDLFDQKTTFANPSGSHVCSSQVELYTCLDVRTGKQLRTDLRSVVEPVPEKRDAMGFGTGTMLWLDDETVISVDHAMVVRGDLRAARATVIYQHPKPYMGMAMRVARLLPGSRYVSVEVRGRPRSGVPDERAIVRVDLRDGSAVTLPADVIAGQDAEVAGLWLDENRYAYSRTTGGLGEIGTWIHDVRVSRSSRVCHLPTGLAGVALDDGVAFVPKRNAFYAFRSVGSAEIIKMDLGAGQCSALSGSFTTHSNRVSRIDPRPFDLR